MSCFNENDEMYVIKRNGEKEIVSFDKILQRNMNAGRAIGIEGTPALLIGDKIIPGAISLEEIKALIHSERDKRQSIE